MFKQNRNKPCRKVMDELIEFKVDISVKYGDDKADHAIKQFLSKIKNKTSNEIIKLVHKTRQMLDIPKKSNYIIRPRPVKTRVIQNKTPKTDIGYVPGDVIADDFTRPVITPDDLQPVNDIRVTLDGDIGYDDYDPYPKSEVWQGDYPYSPQRPPVLDVGDRPFEKRVDPTPENKVRQEIYPYDPSSSAPDPSFGDIGTLMPPRPVLKPWRNNLQKMFAPGDTVVGKVDREVGVIKATRGEEAMVHYGGDKYARVPIQDLARYYGTTKEIKKTERNDTADLTRLVGKNPRRY